MALRLLLGMTVGAALGYANYRFIGCSTGTCPLTRNPYVSTIYGAFMGALALGMLASK